uniref:Phenylalanine--tRNA ligase beta subunit (Trinotate prediction) n=1 Tax=Myxobolus squamalis TaxID=59785 RepID=A0A6B2G0Q3_MYXSQ
MTTRLNLNDSSIESSLLPVKIDSPYEHNCVRNSLIPGILKTISSNRKLALPIKLFEVSDIVIRDSSKANKAVNQRNLCAIYCAASSGFEFIHGVLDRIMSSLEINASFVSSNSISYALIEKDFPMYFPLRSCEIVVNKTVIGHMGILHPTVSKNFEIHQAVCSALEINVEKLLKFYEE